MTGGAIEHGRNSKPPDDGVDSAMPFGESNFVERLCKQLVPGRFRPHPARLS